MEVDSNVTAQVYSCTFSAKDYSQNSKAVFKGIEKDAKNYIKHFLGALYEIFSADDYTHNRFYALLLLVKATETKNPNLMKQLSNSRDLLNRIFKDAQIDLSKPLKEKGKTLFSKKPSKDDITVGNNYMILLLEAICFWRKEFGSENKKDSNYCYYTMYELLCERTQLPGSNYYIGQKIQVNDKFYLQPAKVSDIIEPAPKAVPEKPAATQKATPGEDEISSSEAFMQLITCISSEEDYESQSEVVFNSVAKNDKAYHKSLLQALNEILNKPIYTNVYKFYSLLLLVQLTETGNKTFLNQLVRDMSFLNNLYKQAKEAGDLNGPKMLSFEDADDQEIPHKNQSNILILEAIKYWHVRFGDKDPEHPYANFSKLYEGLASKVLFPEEFIYIKARGVPQRATKETPQTAPDVSDPIMKLVNTCIPSVDSFQAYYYEIIEYLQNNLDKTPIYLQGTLDIFRSATVAPSSKFYALYLLIKVSELIDDPNDLFITALAKNNALMSKLFEDAQFDKQKPSEQKGTNFFSKQPNPQLSILASNYIQMLSEILHFWGQVFETFERPDPKSIFKLISSQLKKLTMVEPKVYYLGRDLGAMENQRLANFEFIPYKSLPEFNNYMLGSSNQLEAQEEQKAEPEVVVVGAKREVEQTSLARQPIIEEEASVPTDDLDMRLANLQKSKDKLKALYLANEQEKPETKGLLQGLYFQINSEYTDEILPNIDHIISGQHKDTDKYAAIISREGETIDVLELDYANYIKNDISYKQLRKNALNILASQDEQAASHSRLHSIQSETSEARRKRTKEQKFYSSGLEDDKDSQNPSAGLHPIQSPLTGNMLSQQSARGNISERINIVTVNQSDPKEKVLTSRAQDRNLAGQLVSDEESIPSHASLGKAGSSRAQYTSKPYSNLAGQLVSDEESIPSRASLAKVSDRVVREAQTANNKPLTDRLNVNQHHAGQLLSDNDNTMMSHIDQKNADLSVRHSQHSMVMTPSRNYDQDLSRLEQSIRMSKAKVKTLNGIEDSIRKSFVNTGKEPPGFKPVADMGVISGLEEEIFKLKEEKTELIRENTSLKNQKATMIQEFNEKEAAQALEIVNLRNEMTKIVEEHDEKETAQDAEIENLRKLLVEYQKRIETVQSQLEEVESAKSKSIVQAAPQQSENQMMTTTKSLTQSSATPIATTNKERQMHSPSLLDKFLTRSNYIPISPTQPMRRNDSRGERLAALSPTQSQYFKNSSYNLAQEKSPPKMEHRNPSTITLNKNYEQQQQQYELKKSIIANPITLSGVRGVSQVKNYTELDKFVSQKPTYWYGDMELQRGDNFGNQQQASDSRTFFNQTNSNVMYVEVKSPPRDKTPRPAGYRTNLFANLKLKIERSAPSSSMDAFYSYKIACLNKESVLYENAALRVDVKTGSVENLTTRENILAITLQYTNKGNDLIRDFSTDFPEVPKASLLHRPTITDAYLGGRSRTEQQVFFSFEEWPLQVPQMYGQYKIHQEKTDFDVFLPTLVTQFMSFGDFDVESFEQVFQENSETVVAESNEVTLDPLIVETSQDFNKYFNKLKYLTQQGQQQILGGCFTLRWSRSNYFLKIRVSPSNKVKFIISTSRENIDYLDIILETFTFLFGKE